MGDEKDPSASTASETAQPAAPAAPMSVVPRPVSIPPRPVGGATPMSPSRMPPPPSSRGILPGAASPSGVRSSMPPPAPQRNAPSSPSAPVSSVAASPSVMPRAPATPPPPPPRYSSSPGFSRPLPQTAVASASVTTQLEQRLGATQIELRKLGSERHTLRSRLRREADRLRELESALRAEKDLHAQASDEHFAAVLGLRSRLAEVEAERDAETARGRSELEQARSELEQVRSELRQVRLELEQASGQLEQARAELEQARSRPADSAPVGVAATARALKVPQGLRRIRGIGPAYQRVLEQAGVTRVQQIASWTEADVLTFADKLKIRPDRISKDDWIGQAQALALDPES